MTNAEGPFAPGTALHLIQASGGYDIVLEHPHLDDIILGTLAGGGLIDRARIEWLVKSAAEYNGIAFFPNYDEGNNAGSEEDRKEAPGADGDNGEPVEARERN